jgi:hypothetical protein
MKQTLSIVLFALVGANMVGCGDETASLPAGSMQLSWLVGTGGCEASAVETVAVYLHREVAAGTDLRTFACSDGEALIDGLEPGIYTISIRGRDAAGVDRFGDEQDSLEVRSSGTTTVPTFRLSALPARVVVSWYFENGRLCSFNEVSTIDIVLFEDEYEIYADTFGCDAGEAELLDIQADTYIVDVVARDESGMALFSGQEEVTVDRGDQSIVEIVLAELATP